MRCDWNCLDFTKDRLLVLELLVGNRMVSGERHAFFEVPGSMPAGRDVVAAGRSAFAEIVRGSLWRGCGAPERRARGSTQIPLITASSAPTKSLA